MKICMQELEHSPHEVDRWHCDGLTVAYVQSVRDDSRLILDKVAKRHFADGISPQWQNYVFRTMAALDRIVGEYT